MDISRANAWVDFMVKEMGSRTVMVTPTISPAAVPQNRKSPSISAKLGTSGASATPRTRVPLRLPASVISSGVMRRVA